MAFGGLYVSDFAGSLFNGMEYGSACVLGVCLYLCVVMVTCTGIIVSKLEKNVTAEESSEPSEKSGNQENDQ